MSDLNDPSSLAAPPLAAPPRVAVIGGGITGLSAAHRLQQLRPELQVTLLEACDRVGGVLQTVAREGYLVERSADNFLTKTRFATELCDRLGLSDQLLPTDPERRRALLVHDGQVKPTPAGFVIAAPRKLWPLMTSDLLSIKGKLRLACEPLIRPRQGDADESVASFARRRLGAEALARLVQPLVGGIYTADLEQLSLLATLPQFREQEQQFGSLWRAARQAAEPTAGAGARYGAFLAPRLGMSQLVDRLEQSLQQQTIRKQVRVEKIVQRGSEWEVVGPAGDSWGTFDGVIVATPAHVAAGLVTSVDDDLARQISQIEYASSVVVCLGYRIDQLPSLPTGFGIVVPHREGRQILAASFSSLKFPGRAPEGELLVRVFIGGALQAELTTRGDQQLVQIAKQELADLTAARGEPRVLEVVRWPNAMPQYHVGHLDRVASIEKLTHRHRGLQLAGAAYRGVGVPQCIASGQQAAERVVAQVV